MGVPRFYRWLSERYPLINEVIEPEQIPEFDCLYLDMNGIIHHCSHGDTPDVAKPEDEVWMDIFKYISDLFTHIKPKKLLYMAVDGVAPRAKMNQQRSRRFRTALDAVEATERAVKNGDHPKSIDTFFDSNSITPGTAFMERLTVQLRFFAQKMISENPLWQGVEVVVSGPNVPGEGEHKIMDYIRATKSQPDYDPNTRHCVYGLDADLIMLSLATHEPYVALLREEVIFGPEKTDARALVRPDRLQLLHIYVLREYLALEFGEEDLERVIDDFVLFCMLVGNDFLPHLPYTGVGDGGLERLFSAYKEYREKQISSADPWLVEHGGGINWANFLQYLTVYSSSEEKFLADEVSKGHWQIGKRRRCGGNGRGGSHMSYEYQLKTGFGYPKSPEEARLQFYKVKGECDDKAEVDELVRDYLEGLQWSYSYYYRGPPSWHWYYRHHYAPFVCTMVNDFDDFVTAGGQIKFDGGGPVTPFQQLMTVLPASSGQRLLPKIFAKLFTSSSSPVKQYYPERFDIDIDGVKVPWGGTTLINFVDEDVLFDAMNAAIAESERTGQDALTEAEKERNVNGGAHVYRYDPSVKPVTVQSTVPRYLQDLTGVTVDVKPFRHPSLPEGMEYFPHWVLPQCDLHKYKDSWPSLHTKAVMPQYAVGVKVFNFASQRQSMFLAVEESYDELMVACKEMMEAYTVQIDYPCVHKGRVVAVRYMRPDGQVVRVTKEGEKLVNSRAFFTDVEDELDYRERHGLRFEFHSEYYKETPNELANVQPILEIRRVLAHRTERSGKRIYEFSPKTELRLAALCRVLEPCPVRVEEAKTGPQLVVGERVICCDMRSVFGGCVGTVVSVNNGGVVVDTEQPSGRSASEVDFVASKFVGGKHKVVWYSPEVAASRAGLTVDLWWMIVGSITAKLGRERVQVGMELFHSTRFEVSPGKSSWRMLVIPNYTRYSHNPVTRQERWSFSNYAVQAVEDYMEAFPSVFDGLCDLDHFDPKLALSAKRLLDTDTDDYEYELAKLKKWLSEQEFRRLPLVSSAYTALPRTGVRSLEVYLNRGVEENPTPPRITVTPEQLAPVENAKFVSKACQERPRVGNRAVYVGSDKPVPVGARCVVTSVYGRPGQDMKVELLFDRCTFGCDTAFGRCSPMRGLVVSPSDILVLPVYPTSPLIPHPPPSGNTYSSPPKEVTLDESPPMNGTGMSRKERSKRKVRKAPTVTYASRHPDTTILSHELRHMLGISPNNNKQQS